MNLTPYQSKITRWLAAVLIIVALAWFGVKYPEPGDVPPFPEYTEDEVVGLGTTHFTALDLTGGETDQLVVDQTGTGDILELQDNGTTVLRVADGGLLSHLGNCTDLDADGDTSLCADTDDQVDIELAGVDAIVLKAWPTSATVTATVNIEEIQGSSPAWTANTNVLNALAIDIAVGNANTGTHTVRGIMVDAITGDAQVTEIGMEIGSGFDTSLKTDDIAETTSAAGVTVDGLTVKDGGLINQDQAKTSNYSVLATDNGDLFTNVGATAEVTFTLPTAVEGLNYCFYVYAAYTVTLELNGSDQFHHLTNAAGDRAQNTGTAGDSVCFTAIDTTYWLPIHETGTWSDVN